MLYRAVLILLGLCLSYVAHGQTTALSVNQVTSSLCLQIKTANLNSTGPTLANAIQDLATLNPNGIGTGIACVRDDGLGGNATSLGTLANLGYALDLYEGYSAPVTISGSAAVATMKSYITAGYNVLAIEGLSQVDLSPSGCVILSTCSYVAAFNGTTYTGSSTTPNWQVAVAAQNDLWQGLGGFAPVYLWSITNAANGASGAPAVAAATALGTTIGAITNNGNVEFFPTAGNSPIAVAQTQVTGQTGYSPTGTQGITGFGITTEGYLNGTNAAKNLYGSAYANAVYTLNSIFINQPGASGSALTAGSNLTSFYSLLPDASGDDFGWFGPYATPLQPRTVATVVRNLMTIIGDAGFSAKTFIPGALSFSVSGLPSGGGYLLMQQSNFAFDIAVWVNANVFTNGVATTAPANNVTVSLGAPAAVVNVYDPVVGTTPVASYTNVSSVVVSVSDHPVIVQVGGMIMCTVPNGP